jgi:hypothetical protein
MILSCESVVTRYTERVHHYFDEDDYSNSEFSDIEYERVEKTKKGKTTYKKYRITPANPIKRRGKKRLLVENGVVENGKDVVKKKH